MLSFILLPKHLTLEMKHDTLTNQFSDEKQDMLFTPTQEQQDILNTFKEHKIMKVNAVAGSGKSSTLRLLAESNIIPSLYVCFNKQNAIQAAKSFPDHTDCRTVHSLAYSVFGKYLIHKLNIFDNVYINRGRTAKEIVKLYDISDFLVSGNVYIPSRTIAVLAKATVDRYQNSTNDHVGLSHTPKKEIEDLEKKYADFNKDSFKLNILSVAEKLWRDKINPKSPVKIEHDTYQKLYQLSKPILPYDIIYLDEAQDSSPVVLDIISNQLHCKVVYVGDTYQSIYAFRQAVNAMEKIKAPTKFLSKSFRYGQGIADLATFIIDGVIQVKGMENIDSKLTKVVSEQYTKIFRTNSSLLSEAVNLIEQGVKVKCEIDPKKFKSMINSSYALFKGDSTNVKDDEIAVYATWSEMLEDAKDNPEIKRLTDIVINNKTFMYTKALDSLIKDVKSNKPYDVLLTTAHKSKGMEWENVIIDDDFNVETILKSVGDEGYNQQEVNLFYVACTRAIKNLQLPKDFLVEYDYALEEFNDTQDEGCNV